MLDKISGTAIGSMLFSPDQTFGTFLSLLQRERMFLVPLHSSHLSLQTQRAKKVVSDSPGLVDLAIGLVNSVFNLPDGQVMFYEEFE